MKIERSECNGIFYSNLVKTKHYANIGMYSIRNEGNKACQTLGGRLPLPKSSTDNQQLVTDLKKLLSNGDSMVYLDATDKSKSGIDYTV